MASYKTPGVYVKEVSTLPASIAAVETAIPAFIGYTQYNSYKGESLDDKPYKISSLLEYEEVFGGAPTTRTYVVVLDSSSNPQGVTVEDNSGSPYYMHDAVRMFYANGGGDCYIVSVGTYGTAPAEQALKDGIDALKKEDEPTLLLFPDAVTLSATSLGAVQVKALSHCAKLQDRFAVLDVKETAGDDVDDNVESFRDEVGINNLKYGAAYTPYVHAGLGAEPTYGSIQLEDDSDNVLSLAVLSSDPAPVLDYDKALADASRLDTVLGVEGQSESTWEEYYGNITAGTAGTEAELNHYLDVIGELAKEIGDLVYSSTASDLLTNSKAITYATSVLSATSGDLRGYMEQAAEIVEDWDTNIVGTVGGSVALTWTAINEATDFDGTPYPDYELDTVGAPAANTYFNSSASSVAAAVASGRNSLRSTFESILALLNSVDSTISDVTNTQEGVLRSTNSVYSAVIKRIKAEGFVMPPSAAIVGKYAEVDSTRGVWKAPANVSLNSVIKLSHSIDNDEQESINVDVTAGKSVNAIRKFKGKGILVWGARTLAGNDNEWRYVPVRRLFIMVEESVKKATEFVVFEPNDANTWGKVKGMISNFLTGLWRDGALAGAKPDAAFFVKCGLGETMTSQDILEGRLIVEVGMAAVRPAEFIILKFSHKLQES